ncbi:hypothetical protein ACJ2CR_23925 [Myxococcus faecalis]|uniref:hypothetical protein n=1 Tax=Myxococcus faecalis TaxID=3115646 RepID=UPI0038D00FF8
MGITSDRLVADYYGTKIEVELNMASMLGTTVAVRLIVADKKADEATVSAGGEATLLGTVKQGEVDKTLRLTVSQGWFGTKYCLLIDGKEHPIQKLK